MASKAKVVRTPLEDSVIKAISEIETSSSAKDYAKDLAGLTIVSAKEVTTNNKKAIVIFVPYRQHKKYKKVQDKLVRELEKKFSNCHVLIIAQRTILSATACKTQGISRPRSRTLTAVHAAILNDIVYPVQIVGQRTRIRQDQSRLQKIFLDPKDVKEVEDKLKTFAGVYSKLTNRAVEFLFPSEN